MKDNKQVTLNEAIERETGEPTPPNTIPIPLDPPARKPRREGFHSKFVHITDEAWAKIQAHIEAGPFNEDKWLTQQMTKLADSL